MTKTSTHDDIIRFFYDEMSGSELIDFQRKLKCDHILKQQYSDFLQTVEIINTSELEPSKRVINRILQASESYNARREKV